MRYSVDLTEELVIYSNDLPKSYVEGLEKIYKDQKNFKMYTEQEYFKKLIEQYNVTPDEIKNWMKKQGIQIKESPTESYRYEITDLSSIQSKYYNYTNYTDYNSTDISSTIENTFPSSSITNDTTKDS